MIAAKRVCRTADGDICSEDDPNAAFLVAAEGAEIPDEYADQVAAFEAKPSTKKTEPAENKAVRSAPNKAATKKS